MTFLVRGKGLVEELLGCCSAVFKVVSAMQISSFARAGIRTAALEVHSHLVIGAMEAQRPARPMPL